MKVPVAILYKEYTRDSIVNTALPASIITMNEAKITP